MKVQDCGLWNITQPMIFRAKDAVDIFLFQILYHAIQHPQRARGGSVIASIMMTKDSVPGHHGQNAHCHAMEAKSQDQGFVSKLNQLKMSA